VSGRLPTGIWLRANAHTHGNRHAHGNVYAHTYPHTQPDFDRNGIADADGHTVVHTNFNVNAVANSHRGDTG
jgi:hypothetical protein